VIVMTAVATPISRGSPGRASRQTCPRAAGSPNSVRPMAGPSIPASSSTTYADINSPSRLTVSWAPTDRMIGMGVTSSRA
jgi:hypothetical protein